MDFDAAVFDEEDELDAAILVNFSTVTESEDMKYQLNKPVIETDLSENTDVSHVFPDEADTSPIGEAAEEYIDAENDVQYYVDDDELIDLVMGIDN